MRRSRSLLEAIKRYELRIPSACPNIEHASIASLRFTKVLQVQNPTQIADKTTEASNS